MSLAMIYIINFSIDKFCHCLYGVFSIFTVSFFILLPLWIRYSTATSIETGDILKHLLRFFGRQLGRRYQVLSIFAVQVIPI